VGTILARAFHARHEVVVLSRGKPPEQMPWRVVRRDGKTPGAWHSEVDGADVVINLAGRSVNCRYSAGNREEIMRSRVDSVRAVGHAIGAVKRPPKVRPRYMRTLLGRRMTRSLESSAVKSRTPTRPTNGIQH
jgi:NAD dependent epimerase/dehydratase family enzyme